MYVNLEGVNCYCSYCETKLDLKAIIEKIKLEVNKSNNESKNINILIKCNHCKAEIIKSINYEIFKSVIFAEESHE